MQALTSTHPLAPNVADEYGEPGVHTMTTYTIAAKMSNTGSIHDIEAEYDRDIDFPPGCIYAVVRASYYGGKGYTTHKTPEAAAKASQGIHRDFSHTIIDRAGREYSVLPGYYNDTLIAR